ncbi:MAG TPA: hypothetical protein VN927_03475, partial [Gemmatimonadaceae bacterium]|nr:hypothetical protein [Gemmatimonadaceae bacterium]
MLTLGILDDTRHAVRLGKKQTRVVWVVAIASHAFPPPEAFRTDRKTHSDARNNESMLDHRPAESEGE